MINNYNFIIENGKVLTKCELSKIIYFTNKEISSEFFTIDHENYVIKTTLPKIESDLQNSSFFKVHYNYIINLNYIAEINYNKGTFVKLKNGILIPVSEIRKCKLLKLASNHFMNKIEIL